MLGSASPDLAVDAGAVVGEGPHLAVATRHLDYALLDPFVDRATQRMAELGEQPEIVDVGRREAGNMGARRRLG